MKKLVLCMLLAVGAFCSASQKEEFQLMIVPDLKAENMLSFKKSLTSQMNSVKTTKYLVYGALAVGGIEMVRRTFFASSDANMVQQKDHVALLRKVDDLEKERDDLKSRVGDLETGRVVPATQWIHWFKDKTKAFGRTVDEWVPSWMSGIVKMYLLSQATSIVWRKVPQIDSYMGLNPTINWCMFSGTSFLEGLGGFKNWYQALIMQPDKHFNEDAQAPVRNLNKKSFAVCCHSLVGAMEEVLGYMSYVTDKLIPTDKNYLVLKARSEVCMESIDAEMKELIGIMNAFLSEESVDAQILGYLMEMWHLKIILILDHLEDFEPVTLATGFKERDGKGGRFNEIKAFINPQIPGKPEPTATTGPLEEAATEAIEEVAEKANAVASKFLG